MPPFLTRNMRGETDSELAFHVFLQHLYRDGTLNDPALSAERLGDYLRALDQGVSGQAAVAMCVTNGQTMAMINRGVATHYSLREGIPGCGEHTSPEPQLHARFKGVMLGAEMADPGHQWREVADGSLITVSRELELKVQLL